MSRRPAIVTQADVARALRAAKQAGAEGVEIQPDGRIVILLKEQPSIVPSDDPFTAWEREYESTKTARRR